MNFQPSKSGRTPWLLGALWCCLLLATSTPAAEPAESESASSTLAPLVEVLLLVNDAAVQRDVIRGMREALKGRKQVTMPGNWPMAAKRLTVSDDDEVRRGSLVLSLIFGDQQTCELLKSQVADPQQPPDERKWALDALVQQRVGGLSPMLHNLLGDHKLVREALRGLASEPHPETPGVILKRYAGLPAEARGDAVQTLSSRPAWALMLLQAIEDGQVPRGDLSAFVARQLTSMGSEEINARLNQVWGSIRTTRSDKLALIAQHKQALTAEVMKKAQPGSGRVVFKKICAACHELFDDGRKVGPTLTGSQRTNLDYVFENLVDPSAVVGRDYQMTVLQTVDGRILNGIVLREDTQTLTIQTQNDVVLLPVADVEIREKSKISLMPEGILDKLRPEEIRDLVAYLASPEQVPLPEGAATGNQASGQ